MAKPSLKLVHGFAPPEDVESLAIAKLESSGLTREDGKRLGLSWHNAAETKALSPSFWPLPSLQIPYYAPVAGKVPLRAGVAWPAFYRVRALRDPIPKPDDFKKYLQPPDTGVCAYFPALLDWAAVRSDHQQSVVITEGELKAAKGCVEGFNAIGLGGVNSYGRKRLGIELLPELETFVWARRRVYLIFDSDLQANTNVCRALNDLAETLTDRGALPSLVLLPTSEDGTKVGLDDFLVANHPDVLKAMIAEAIPLAVARPLWQLNDQYAYVPAMDRVVRRDAGYLTSPAAFRNASTAKFFEQVVKDNGSISTTKVSAADRWLDWPLRQDVHKLTYSPGYDPLDLIPSSADGAGAFDADYNTWTGWGVVPRPGDASLFLKLVDHLFVGSDPGAKDWFLRWCAYPLQHPGTKLFSSAVVHGLEQGTGKSLIGYTLGKIYGRNFAEIAQHDIHNGFNEWAIGKQLIMGDDVTGSDKRQDLDLLKKMITQREIRINAKNQPTYLLPDCINYLWTSNQPDAFFLEDKDRRFFVHEVIVPPLPKEFYSAYDVWLRGAEGPAAVFDFLLNLPLDDFDPYARAFDTSAKTRMTRSSRSDLGNWVRDLDRDPDEFLTVAGIPMSGDLFTNRQLVHAYASRAGIEPNTIPGKRMASELGRAGIRQVHGGAMVTGKGLAADRYYAIRNRTKWLTATLKEIQDHLASDMPEEKPVTKKATGQKPKKY